MKADRVRVWKASHATVLYHQMFKQPKLDKDEGAADARWPHLSTLSPIHGSLQCSACTLGFRSA